MSLSLNEIVTQIQQLHNRQMEERREALKPAQARIDEIDSQIRALEAERRKLQEFIAAQLGESPKPVARPRTTPTRSRVAPEKKKAIIASHINQGHIKLGEALSAEVRAALTDEGFGAHDFRKLQDYLPSGWKVETNGRRGRAAQTIFVKA
jgi:chorismate mutase